MFSFLTSGGAPVSHITGKRGTAVPVKRLRGIARLPPAGGPRVRANAGIMAMAPSSSTSQEGDHSFNTLAVASLNPEVPSQVELTVMTVTTAGCGEELSSMTVARRTFNFSAEPSQGISKVVWAGRTTIAVMSSVGEVVCLRSGLCEPSNAQNDSENDDGGDGTCEGDSSVLLRIPQHAIDVCALTVNGYAVIVTTDHIRTESYAFAISGGAAAASHQHRELSIGAFQLISGLSDCHGCPAVLLGCTLGSVVLFEWASVKEKPIAIRSLLMGPTTRYMAISAGVQYVSVATSGEEVERVVTFCALGNTGAEDQAERGALSLKMADGTPLCVMETVSDSTASHYSSVLPSWNDVCRLDSGRPQSVSSLLLVTQPQLSPTAAVPQILVVSVAQDKLHVLRNTSCTDVPAGKREGSAEALRPETTIDAQIFLATSLECKNALSMFRGDATMVATIRRPRNTTPGKLGGELCLFDSERAIVFGLCENCEVEPRASVGVEHESSLLAGLVWPFDTSDALLLLSGKLLDGCHGSNDVSNDARPKGETKKVTVRTIGDLTLVSEIPQPWRRSGAAGLDEERLTEVVRAVVRQENEKMMQRLEKRLEAIERTLSLLSSQRGRE
ncbi:hypothetical protein, conserved [Trypanosoma brucei gambiense DAL972]|uniref:Uncharacterized protein n=1 Tax=Trypanosoma brucei gambiense (strain MHOM/CI/86/DAL972) TaxID=679716 RepID=C9ZLZ4_TRYB9|nr:hypothetical protein, conserved [Trypanosoma brucei gambiense DAL972]CBH10419.1 hypothetical protein, conserved [Trypanosoma brucei gambiense DAL972]|eukprot:XP_011772709.1 hypothetical protein, conserved [Trypanosoma brucei gambiense DAL972]